MTIYYVDFEKNTTTQVTETEEVLVEISPQDVLTRLTEEVRKHNRMAYDLETSGLDPYVNYPLMVQVASPESVVIFRAGQVADFSIIGELLADKTIVVLGHNIMFDYKFSLRHFGWRIISIWDTMLAEGCLISGRLDPNFRPSSASLEATVNRHFGIVLDKGTRKNFVGRPGETAFTHAELLYGAKDVSILFDLARGQELRVKELGLEKVVRLENRFIQITAEMELNGFAVDLKTWKALTKKYEEQYLETLEKLYETFRNENSAVQLSFFDDTLYKIDAYVKALNLKSPKAMLALLKAAGIEDELGWKIPDTKRETLDKMAEELEHKGVTNDKIKLVLDFRKKSKLLDAFMYKIPKMLNPVTGKLHAGYIQMPVDDSSGRVGGTSTGRLACIAEGQLVSVPGGYKKIEDIVTGDLVYCYTPSGEIAIKKVLNNWDNGFGECVRVKWQSSGSMDTGSLVCTGHHLIRTKQGEWVRADSLKRHQKLTHLRRSLQVSGRVRLYGPNSFMAMEEAVIKKAYYGAPRYMHAHHKNDLKDDNRVDNIEVLTPLEHRNVHGYDLISGRKPRKYFQPNYDYPLGEDHPCWIKQSKYQILRKIAKAGGKVREASMDFDTLKRKAKLLSVDLAVVKLRYNDAGEYLSVGRILREFEKDSRVEQASKGLGIGTRKLKELCKFYGISYNHAVTSVKPCGKFRVFDLEVEEHANFIASEICVHNSKSPNFQQMPAIGELRHCFIANPGYKIITMDYASHEVRVAANYTQDPALVNFFNTDKNLPSDPSMYPVVDPNDFHGYSASLVFSLPLEKVAKSITLNEAGEHIELNPPMRNFRQLAKVATFAIFYGAKAFGLAPKLGLTEDEANDVVARYGMAYPEAIRKLTRVGYDSFGKGVVTGCIGRIKYLETNEKFKNKSMRQARNYVIQNTNAEQLKYAMFLIRNRFSYDDLRILSSVHDEIVFEVKENIAHDVAIELKELMIYGAKTVLDGPVKYDASYSIEDYWTK